MSDLVGDLHINPESHPLTKNFPPVYRYLNSSWGISGPIELYRSDREDYDFVQDHFPKVELVAIAIVPPLPLLYLEENAERIIFIHGEFSADGVSIAAVVNATVNGQNVRCSIIQAWEEDVD